MIIFASRDRDFVTARGYAVGIVWREGLSVDRGVIDTDHRYLINLINAIEKAICEDRPVAELCSGIDGLSRYTRQHFLREEEIMIAHRYPRFDHHKALHRMLIEQLNEVAGPILSATPPDVPASNAVDKRCLAGVAELLRSWLLDHIVREDLKLKPLLAR